LLNFKPEPKALKRSKKQIRNSINLVVMAEGYRADEITYFSAYAEDAFSKSENFNFTEYNDNSSHTHIKNHFYEKYWDSINVYMYETISPQSGIDATWGRNEVMSFFDVNRGSRSDINFSRMERVVDETWGGAGSDKPLQAWNVDAYIILVNDRSISSYAYAYDKQVGERNGQPVNFIIIRAPIDYFVSVDALDFHGLVETDRIGQLLGRAMARLMMEDKYTDKDINGPTFSYNHKYRNISRYGGEQVKWKKLWEKEGYRTYSQADNDHRLVELKNPIYYDPVDWRNNEYFIPTRNGTMRGDSGSMSYQFGPVCTYHMEGSFRTRMNLNNMKDQDPEYDGINYEKYEWEGYSLEAFMEEYSPDYFYGKD